MSPPPATRSARKSHISNSASTPSIPSLAAPTPASLRKSASSRVLSPKAAAARPALPAHARNHVMDNHEGRLHKVKTQVLFLGDGPDDQHTITIARVKCPVPKDVPG